MTLASSPSLKFIYLERGRYCLNLKWQHKIVLQTEFGICVTMVSYRQELEG